MHQNKFLTLTVAAGADLSAVQYKAIAIGGTIAATSELSFGLLQNKPAASGRQATLGYLGQMKAYAGAAITLGADIMVTTSGFLIAATSGSLVSGQALLAANSGDLFPGVFNFVNAAQR